MESNRKRKLVSIGIWEKHVWDRIMLTIPINHKAITINNPTPQSTAKNTYPILESDAEDSFTIILDEL